MFALFFPLHCLILWHIVYSTMFQCIFRYLLILVSLAHHVRSNGSILPSRRVSVFSASFSNRVTGEVHVPALHRVNHSNVRSCRKRRSAVRLLTFISVTSTAIWFPFASWGPFQPLLGSYLVTLFDSLRGYSVRAPIPQASSGATSRDLTVTVSVHFSCPRFVLLLWRRAWAGDISKNISISFVFICYSCEWISRLVLAIAYHWAALSHL